MRSSLAGEHARAKQVVVDALAATQAADGVVAMQREISGG
jgi:hypothetical protein